LRIDLTADSIVIFFLIQVLGEMGNGQGKVTIMEEENKKEEERLDAKETTNSSCSTSWDLVGWGYLPPEVALPFFTPLVEKPHASR